MAEDRRHPTWEEMRALLTADAPTLHVLTGEPEAAMFIDPDGPRIGLRVAYPSGEYEIDEPLAEIDVRLALAGGRRVIEVSTRNRSMFDVFFAFGLAVADRIQLEHADVPSALDSAMQQWRALVRRATMLSEEQQIGLMGELWMLQRLARRSPRAGLEAWTGPAGEAHDFRVGDREFEVKATRSERRNHLISHVMQLVPSPGRSLFLLSLQFAAAGSQAGASLSDELAAARELLERYRLGSAFDRLVELRFGLRREDWSWYRERMILRTAPVIVPVTEELPSIRQADIDAIPRAGMERVSDVRYRLDITGLGYEDGSPAFLELLPSAGEDS